MVSENWYSKEWNDGVTPWNAHPKTALEEVERIIRNWHSTPKSAESCPQQGQTMTAVESYPEVGGATYMPGVYKLPMVRM